MKKLFLGSLALLTFSSSILIFQFSCKKTVEAQQSSGSSNFILPIATTSILGGVKPDGSTTFVDANGVLYTSNRNELFVYLKQSVSNPNASEYYVCTKDGNNKQKINLPTNIFLRDGPPSIMADNKTVVFTASTTPVTSNGIREIYTMNIDGSNLAKILGNDPANHYNHQ